MLGPNSNAGGQRGEIVAPTNIVGTATMIGPARAWSWHLVGGAAVNVFADEYGTKKAPPDRVRRPGGWRPRAELERRAEPPCTITVSRLKVGAQSASSGGSCSSGRVVTERQRSACTGARRARRCSWTVKFGSGGRRGLLREASRRGAAAGSAVPRGGASDGSAASYERKRCRQGGASPGERRHGSGASMVVVNANAGPVGSMAKMIVQ